jgi:glycerol kinase
MIQKKYVAAIDQGTTSTRFIVYDKMARAVGLAQKEHRQIYPQPGWVEHDPLEIWNNTQEVIKSGLDRSGISGSEISAIGITNQRETTVVWNRYTGKPYYNAIVWQDVRTYDICRDLSKDGGQNRFQSKVGLPLATYFSGPKLKWILDYVRGVRKAAEHGDAIFGNMDTWEIWWLTGGPRSGVHITDVTNASRTMLMNLETMDWDQEILDIMTIPREMLPEIRPSSDFSFFGKTQTNSILGASIPVSGDLGDQQAALVGQTCYSPGEAKNTYGTGCFLLRNTGTDRVLSQSGLLTTVAYKLGNEPAVYALEGSVAMAGALVQWLRDNLGIIKEARDIEALAKSVDNNGGIYLVPAFSGLFAPYWRSDARGIIIGLTRHTNKGHFARSVLESTAFQTREIIDAMEHDVGIPLKILKVDGGMVYNDLLMQLQADILNVKVIRPRVTETTSLGAAYAAGYAVGFWDDTEALRANWQAEKVWEPQINEQIRQELYHGWKKAVERTLNWIDDK